MAEPLLLCCSPMCSCTAELLLSVLGLNLRAKLALWSCSICCCICSRSFCSCSVCSLNSAASFLAALAAISEVKLFAAAWTRRTTSASCCSAGSTACRCAAATASAAFARRSASRSAARAASASASVLTRPRVAASNSVTAASHSPASSWRGSRWSRSCCQTSVARIFFFHSSACNIDLWYTDAWCNIAIGFKRCRGRTTRSDVCEACWL